MLSFLVKIQKLYETIQRSFHKKLNEGIRIHKLKKKQLGGAHQIVIIRG